MTALIALQNVSVEANGKRVLEKISLSLEPGQCIGVIGSSGSGKTSILMTMLGFMIPTEGEVLCRGQNISHNLRILRETVQPLFQDVLNSLNPKHTIETSLRETKNLKQIDRVMMQFDLTGELLKRFPHQLSTGERQRICFARVQLTNAKVWLLDEPTSALDAHLADNAFRFLKDHIQDASNGALVISHDLNRLRKVATHIALVDDGTISEFNTAELFFSRPQTELAQRLVQTAAISQQMT